MEHPCPPVLASLVVTHPALIERVCATADPAIPAMAAARAAAGRGDLLAAAQAIVAYWRGQPCAAWLATEPLTEAEPDGPDILACAAEVMAGRNALAGIWAAIPRRADGGWDWRSNGPLGDREWGWSLNRHRSLGYLRRAYQTSGEVRYLRRLDAMLWDWVASCPYPGHETWEPDWRGLEVFHRLAVWSRVFHQLRRPDGLSDATIIAVLASVPDHAHCLRHHHAPRDNWLSMEMNGLAIAGCAWPECADAAAWRRYAAETIAPEVQKQVYPDGAQRELTFHYHHVTERNFSAIAATFAGSGHGELLPPAFHAGIASMWDYIGQVVDQRGVGPQNNDSDALDVSALLASRPAVVTGGTAPSRCAPWAGQLVMRSGWGPSDQWACFDAGPWGTAHQHNDALSLEVRHGRPLLVDSGRGSYVADGWRAYLTGTASHNTVLVDGRGQRPGPAQATAPLPSTDWVITPDRDFCRGRFASGYDGITGTATHVRSVLYRRGGWWLVVDAVATDRGRTLTGHWHLPPGCTATLDGTALCTTDAGLGNVRVRPLLGIVGVELVRGRGLPEPLGWHSRGYGRREPSPTGVWRWCGDVLPVQVWLIETGLGEVPCRRASARVSGTAVEADVAGERIHLDALSGLPEGR